MTVSEDFRLQELPWGQPLWGVSGALANSEHLTVGWCVLKPGMANDRHYHPNCDEVLIVVHGRIVHSWNSDEIEMNEGDVVSLPRGVIHNARNVGKEPARLLICFSSADRKTVNLEELEA